MTFASYVKSATAALFSLVALTQTAFALETKAFDPAGFKAAQDAGKPVIIDVFAPWCPTCKAQQKVLESIKDKPELAGVTVFKVDYDTQTDALAAFKVNRQSTIIAFKGATETARATGVTDAGAIEALIGTALK